MRTATFLSLLLACFAFSSMKDKEMKDGELNGRWIPVKQEMAGKTVPVGAYEKQRLIINDSTYTVIAESVDKGVLTYSSGKMDIYGKEGVNKGQHFTAIYKYDNGLLTICYNLAGTAYPEAFETKGKPLFFLSVFRKE